MRLPKFLQKRRAIVTPEDDGTEHNEYYESISSRLGLLQVILFLSLFAFIVIAVLSNTELVTYQNFYYFFQDLSASAETVDIFDADSLSYQTDDEQDFALYRGGLAVAGNTSVTIFSATGRQIVSSVVQLRDPTAVGAGKYLLVYEMGGTQYALYNSNAQIYSGKTDYPISGAAVSDSGMYAIVSASEDFTSVVSLYTNRFQLINRYQKKGYVTGVSIDPDGDTVAILTSSPANGLFDTTLMLAEPGKGEAISQTHVSDALGIACTFLDGGKIAVLCSDGVVHLSNTGKVLSEYSFEGKTVALFDLSANGISVVLKKNIISPKNIVIVFDKNGKQVYNKTVAEEVTSIARWTDYFFWMSASGIYREDMKNQKQTFLTCRTDVHTMLAVSRDEVLLCSPQKAVYRSFAFA